MSAKLIINADDFGFSPGVTDGILHAHQNGVLTSTTLMTTMPDCDRAIDLAAENPRLGVGIHLCLTQGKPRTSCRRILSRNGDFFRSLPRLFIKLRSRAAREEAQDELIAQIHYAQNRGLKPTHVDSHKHVCHLPALHEPTIAACQATGIHWLRTAREIRVAELAGANMPYRMLARFAGQLAQRAQRAKLKTTDWFFGLASTGKTTLPVYKALAAHLKNSAGLGELMVHPGYARDIEPRETRLIQERENEMAALIDPRVAKLLADAKIKLVRFGE